MSIEHMKTIGASHRTASQDDLPAGLAGSEAMAKRDQQYIHQYRGMIVDVGKQLKIEPALIAAIISRESRGGTAIRESGGWGHDGNAFGLMQVCRACNILHGEWDSKKNIYQGTNILRNFVDSPSNPFTDPNQRLKAGIAAYNKGFEWMSRNFNKIDDHTTGRDYSDDVVARAKYFKRVGFL